MLEQRYFNENVKNKYLDSIEHPETRKLTMHPFIKGKEAEELLNKDIHDMSIDELGKVMSNIASSTANAAYINAVRLEHYIDWAIQNGYASSNINPLTSENKAEWAKQYVATYKQSAFTRDQLLGMFDKLVNDVDKAVLLALFEGISGEGYSELLNLKTQDIREEEGKYFVTLYNKDNTTREIEITEELAKLLVRTNRQSEYINKNGELTRDKKTYSPLLDSPNVFKKTTRGKQEGELDVFFVNRKFQLYKKVFGFGHLKAKDIEKSGIMHMVHEVYSKKGKVETEDYKAIADHFDIVTATVEGYEFRKIALIKTLVSSDLFKNLYGYEIK